VSAANGPILLTNQASDQPGKQYFVIGGFRFHGFDALLVGVYENKRLIFVAKVKDGFCARIRDEIFPALKSWELSTARSAEKRASRWGRR
jgi:hypothetical protein